MIDFILGFWELNTQEKIVNLMLMGLIFGMGYGVAMLTMQMNPLKYFLLLFFGLPLIYSVVDTGSRLFMVPFFLGFLKKQFEYWGWRFHPLDWIENFIDYYVSLRDRLKPPPLYTQQAQSETRFEDEEKIRRRAEEYARFTEGTYHSREEELEEEVRQLKEELEKLRRQNQRREKEGSTKGNRKTTKQQKPASSKFNRNSVVTRHLHMLSLFSEEPYSQADIKKAYRKKALETHPDTGGTEADFMRVNIAYEYLRGLGEMV